MEKKRFKLVNIIPAFSIISLILLALIIVLLQIFVNFREFNKRAKKMRDDYVEQQKEMVKHEVERVVEIINFQQSLITKRVKEIAKRKTYKACAIAQNIYDQNIADKSEAEIKKMIIDAISPIRYEKEKEYYFIVRLDGTVILNVDKPEIEDRNLIDEETVLKKNIAENLIKTSQKNGEGFFEYNWTKRNAEGKDHKKISFVKLFKPFGWLIGAGTYIEDVEENTKKELLTEISRFKYGKEGYIFVNRLNGEALVSNGKVFDGTKKLWEIFENPEVIKNIFEKEYTAAIKPNGDFIYYSWIKLSDSTKKTPKTSFIYGIPSWNWLIGAGVYLDDVKTEITSLYTALNRVLLTEIKITVCVTVVVIAVFMLLFYVINRHLLNDFALFVNFFNQAAYADIEIEQSKVRFEELFKIAGSANKMLHDKIVAQRNLLNEKEQLTVTLQSIGDGVITTDLEGNIVLMNRVAEELTGWNEAEAKGNKLTNILNIINKITGEPIKNPVEKVINSGKIDEIASHSVLISHSGAKYDIADSAAPIKNIDDNIIGVVLVFRDITKKLKVEQEQLKLEKLESVGVLAGGIAHDFNNLLTGLFGNVELAKMYLPEDHKSVKLLENAGQAMDRATNLTKQLLTFAKGGNPIKETRFIGPVIVETAEFCLRGSNVKLKKSVALDLWPVEVDLGQLNQVISNLVINAQQAMPDGGVINIKAENIESSNEKFVQITVQDGGIGISPNYLNKIFDPYFSTKKQGSGLGLASAYSIITKHNGTISVDSIPNVGTTFTIRLPASQRASLPATEKSVAVAADKFGFSNKILVLDDEKIVREVIGSMLEKIGFNVTCVEEGQEAVDKYRESFNNNSLFDVIITDLTIPGGMGGKITAQEILKINPAAKIIVSSGYATDPVMADFKQFGFVARIVKPYRFAELQKVINEQLKD